MIGGIGEMRDTRLIQDIPIEDTYSLDPYMTKPATNQAERVKMKKYLHSAIIFALTDKQRQVLKMYYDEGKNMVEIAEILGIKKQSVQGLIKRAKAKLLKVC